MSKGSFKNAIQSHSVEIIIGLLIIITGFVGYQAYQTNQLKVLADEIDTNQEQLANKIDVIYNTVASSDPDSETINSIYSTVNNIEETVNELSY